MTNCLQCGGPTRVVRVIVKGDSTWREEKCTLDHEHETVVTEQRLGDPKMYRRIRAEYLQEHRKTDDTGIIKMHAAS